MPVQFTDISGHWAKSSIETFVSLGITKGYPDSTFRPDNLITRAEFVKMIVMAARLPATPLNPGETGTFSDVPVTHWVSPYLEAAVDHGLVKPSEYAGGQFGPGVNITREEMAVMIVRALGLDAMAYMAQFIPLPFADTGDITSWRRGYLTMAWTGKIMGGYPDNTIKPTANAKRAEAVVMITRMLSQAPSR